MQMIMIGRTLILYFFLVVVYRIMGKKELGQLSITDLLVFLLIIEIAAISISEYRESLWGAIASISVLTVLQCLFSFIALKSKKIKHFVEGKPIVIIKNGKLNFQGMAKLRYSLEDLIGQLREKGFKSIEEVKYAILENSGRLSVFDKTKEYPLPLIVDGLVDYDVLREIKKDKQWLQMILEKRHLKKEDVFYAFYTKERTFIITKQEVKGGYSSR